MSVSQVVHVTFFVCAVVVNVMAKISASIIGGGHSNMASAV